jgi:hypothetical protein
MKSISAAIAPAWGKAGGILCKSGFNVHNYLAEYTSRHSESSSQKSEWEITPDTYF